MIGDKELTNKEKIDWLETNMPYRYYKTLLDAGFYEGKLVTLYEHIQDEFAYFCAFEGIFKEPNGSLEEEDTTIKIWINQTTNGGYSGDEYAGTVYAEIEKGIYLAWTYHCG